MKVAVIDIGSNTSLLLIAEISDKSYHLPSILEDQLFFTRLAEGFSQKKEIRKSALERQKRFFEEAQKIIHQYKVDEIRCVATAAARTAENADQLLSLGKTYGFSINIISSEKEAILSRKGALFQLPVENDSAMVLDIGGASSEISTVDQFYSIPIGSVSLTEEFLHSDPPIEKEIEALTKKIQIELDAVPVSFLKCSTLVATAGTPTTLAALRNSTERISQLHGQQLSKEEVHLWWEYLFQISKERRKNIKGMPVYRADVMPAGLSILVEVMNRFKWIECTVSTTGLRYGLLL